MTYLNNGKDETWLVWDKYVDPGAFYDDIIDDGIHDVGQLATIIEDFICYWVEEEELSQVEAGSLAQEAIFRLMDKVDWYAIAKEVTLAYPTIFINIED